MKTQYEQPEVQVLLLVVEQNIMSEDLNPVSGPTWG